MDSKRQPRNKPMSRSACRQIGVRIGESIIVVIIGVWRRSSTLRPISWARWMMLTVVPRAVVVKALPLGGLRCQECRKIGMFPCWGWGLRSNGGSGRGKREGKFAPGKWNCRRLRWGVFWGICRGR